MDLIEQLNHVFYPRAVAVVGASLTPGKVGFLCLTDILDAGFKGKVYPVNPGLTEAFGLKVYPSVSAIPGDVDLAVIVVPAEAAVSVVAECVTRGVKGAVLITSGFKEVGTAAGLDMQRKITDIARRGGMQIIGPNTIGLINPSVNLNATFQAAMGAIKPGSVAVAAQSGGMCGFIAQSLGSNNVGVSKAMGLGNRGALDFDQVLTYFAADEQTRVITIYVEGLEQPRKLMAVARQVVKQKPVLALKGGRSEQSNRATLSHTGALAGRNELYRAAFTQAGIMVVDTTTDLVDKAKALAFQPPASGNRVAIVSSMGGPAIVTADACFAAGLKLAQFSPPTWQRLRQLVSRLTSVDNPVDMAWGAGDYDASRGILTALMEEDGVDGLIAILDSTFGLPFVRASIDMAGKYEKPMTVCIGPPSGATVTQQTLLDDSGIPAYSFPERAVSGLAGLVQYGEIQRRFR